MLAGFTRTFFFSYLIHLKFEVNQLLFIIFCFVRKKGKKSFGEKAKWQETSEFLSYRVSKRKVLSTAN